MSVNYIFACFVLGLGIGLDVILATFSRLKYFTPMSGWIWVRRITTTHTLFPMLGYYGFIELFYLFPALRVVLGIIALSLIVLFLVKLVRGWFNVSGEYDVGNPFSWSVVLSVSWDALFSGPAKSAQAIYWDQNQVFFSFIISGLFVTILTVFAVKCTFFLRRVAATVLKTSISKYVLVQLIMMFTEFVIFLYFGILALARYSFFSDVSSWVVGLISFAFGFTLFIFTYKLLIPIVNEQITKELTEPSECVDNIETRS